MRGNFQGSMVNIGKLSTFDQFEKGSSMFIDLLSQILSLAAAGQVVLAPGTVLIAQKGFDAINSSDGSDTFVDAGTECVVADPFRFSSTYIYLSSVDSSWLAVDIPVDSLVAKFYLKQLPETT